MSKNNSRRNFIQKVAAATTGAVLAGKNSLAASAEKNMEELVIKSIKPLGFQWETQDPFLFCVHHEDFFPKGNDNLGPADSLEGRRIGNDFEIKNGYRMYHGTAVSGFPGHPHRGFETVTVVRKGMVDHTDSLGGSGRYGDGDVQWMTAGKGVQHAEMFPCIKKDEENPMELFQIWLNLPKVNKFAEPKYKMLWGENIPKHTFKDANNKKTLVEVVAGKIENDIAPSPTPNSWAATVDHHVRVLTVKIESSAKWTLPATDLSADRNIYFYSGDKLIVDGLSIEKDHQVTLNPDVDIVLENKSEEDAFLLILEGKPIGEPVAQHGPFVMNTFEEIQQAIADYQRTQFGGWPWAEREKTHAANKGRFALHADGTEENKG